MTMNKNIPQKPDDREVAVLLKVNKVLRFDLILRLKYYNLSMTSFFRICVDSFLNKDPLFMNYLHSVLEAKKVTKKNMKKYNSSVQKGKEMSDLFVLEDDEIEKFYDLIDKEQPDL